MWCFNFLLRLAARTEMMSRFWWWLLVVIVWVHKNSTKYFSRKFIWRTFEQCIYSYMYTHDPNRDRTSCQMFAVDLFCFMSLTKTVHSLRVAKDFCRVVKENAEEISWRQKFCILFVMKINEFYRKNQVVGLVHSNVSHIVQRTSVDCEEK